MQDFFQQQYVEEMRHAKESWLIVVVWSIAEDEILTCTRRECNFHPWCRNTLFKQAVISFLIDHLAKLVSWTCYVGSWTIGDFAHLFLCSRNNNYSMQRSSSFWFTSISSISFNNSIPVWPLNVSTSNGPVHHFQWVDVIPPRSLTARPWIVPETQ